MTGVQTCALPISLTTTPSYNSALGDSALRWNTGGSYNTAIGAQSLNSNTTASNNTAVGYQAGYSNTTGTNNIFFGFQSGYGSTGSYATCIGIQAGAANTEASYGNVFVGYQAGQRNTSGVNVAIGSYAGLNTTTGTNNISLGLYALYSNTTASNNTAVGYQAGYYTTTAYNSSLGYQAGIATASATSTRNTSIGPFAGGALTSGSYNTFVGSLGSGGVSAGSAVTTGSSNTILGNYTGNQGNLDIRTLSNWIVLSDGDGNPRQFMTNDSVTYYRNTSSATDGISLVGQPSSGSAWGALSLGSSYAACGSKDVGLFLQTNAGQRIYVQNRSAGVYLADGGTSWTSNSDERLKTELVPFENAADRKSTRLNSSHIPLSRMPSSA